MAAEEIKKGDWVEIDPEYMPEFFKSLRDRIDYLEDEYNKKHVKCSSYKTLKVVDNYVYLDFGFDAVVDKKHLSKDQAPIVVEDGKFKSSVLLKY